MHSKIHSLATANAKLDLRPISGLRLDEEPARNRETYIFQTWTLLSEINANLDRVTLGQRAQTRVDGHFSKESVFLVEQL